MAHPQPLAFTSWLLRLVGAGLLMLASWMSLREGHQAITTGHVTFRYTLEDDCGRKWQVVHEYAGARARQMGGGLLASALVAALWLLPTLWPGWWSIDLRRKRFLGLSLGTYAAALLLIWPPWQIMNSGIAAVTYLLLTEFAVWRRLTRCIAGRRREVLRGRAFLVSFMSINGLGLLLFGIDALSASWEGGALAGGAILHFSLLRWSPSKLSGSAPEQ